MAAHDSLGPQFHEMTREQFESQPNLWWHGTQTGIIGHQGGSFHVGSKEAATQAVGARIAKDYGPQRWRVEGGTVQGHPTAEIRGGHITAPMVNTPKPHSSRGPGNKWEHREGIPWGAMVKWPRRSQDEVMSDIQANALELGVKQRRQRMRQGIYYVNAVEGSGNEPEKDPEKLPVSAIIPNRGGFKTHEDYVIQAKAQGKKIPSHVLKQYPNLGQGRLV